VDEPTRWWTLTEANEALGWVSRTVERAQALWAEYQSKARKQVRVVRQNGHGVVPVDPKPIKECIDQLADEGILLRDIERGLIDFPAQASDGRWYWLCWLVGEPEVAWWHWPEEGFAGRAPIADVPD
jgi:hypothetical protein